MDLREFTLAGISLDGKVIHEDSLEESGSDNSGEASAGTVAANPEAPAEGAQQQGGGSLLSIVLIYGAFFLVIYFLIFRKPRKEQKAKEEMRSNIRVGDKIMTNGGFFGKVVDIGTDVFLIEFGTNRGMRIYVKKEAVEGIQEPVTTPPPAAEEIEDKKDKKDSKTKD